MGWREQLLTSGHFGSSFILLISFRDRRDELGQLSEFEFHFRAISRLAMAGFFSV
jgi:hypothetical protein